MNPPALLILAAGQGRRFGGPKQLASIGPQGEILTAYTVFDAIRAGFGQIVVVTSEGCAEPLEAELGPLVGRCRATLSIVIQPDRPRTRAGVRPGSWGTGHAVLSAQDVIDASFAVANGDDWYGPSAHRLVASALMSDVSAADTHFLVTYSIANTLGDTTGVSRAQCAIRNDGSLARIEELLDIQFVGDRIAGFAEDGSRLDILPGTPVSTNLWGFRASIFEHLAAQFDQFARSGAPEDECEFALPTQLNRLLEAGSIRVETRPADESMFGLTNPEDLPRVQARIADLVASGVYPADLRSG